MVSADTIILEGYPLEAWRGHLVRFTVLDPAKLDRAVERIWAENPEVAKIVAMPNGDDPGKTWERPE